MANDVRGHTPLREKMMKSLLGALPLLLLLGCPLYDEDCSGGQACAEGFRCDGYSSRCVPVPTARACMGPDQCAVAETCTPDFVCRPGSCDYHGCVVGFTCAIVDGAHACVAAGGSPGVPAVQDAGADAMAAPSAADAAAAGDASPDSGANEPPDASVLDAGP